MDARAVLCIGLLVGAGLLSGCADANEAQAPPVVAVASPEAAKGTVLRVLVITDEYLPVPNAKVIIVGLGVNGTTDALGDAFFHIAQPGRYAVHVHRAGFYPNQSKVVVEATDDAVLRVRLRDAPHDAYYGDFYYYTGLCGPTLFVRGVSEGPACNEQPNFPEPSARFHLMEGLTDAFLELNWDEVPGGASAMRLELRFPEAGAFADGRETLVAQGPSPVQIRVPYELLTDAHRRNGVVVEADVGLSDAEPVSLSAQQVFHIEAEFDYFVPAPDVDPST